MVFHDPREEKLQPKAKLRQVGRKSTLHLPTGHCAIFEDKLLTWRLDRCVSDMEGQSPSCISPQVQSVTENHPPQSGRQPSDEMDSGGLKCMGSGVRLCAMATALVSTQQEAPFS